jgi:hypothetical protein
MKITTAVRVVAISALCFWTGIGEHVVHAATGNARIVITSQPLRGYSVDVSINGKKVAAVDQYRPYHGEIAPGKTIVAVEGEGIEFDAKPNHEYVLEITMIPPSTAATLFFGMLAPPSGYSIALEKTIKPEGTEEKKTLSVTQGAGPIAQKGGKGPIATSSVTTSAIQPAQPAIMADPSIAAAWRELAKRFQATGENDKAIRAYENADKFEPGNAATLEALGALYAKSGQRDKVHQVWERLSQIDKARAEQFFSTYLRP